MDTIKDHEMIKDHENKISLMKLQHQETIARLTAGKAPVILSRLPATRRPTCPDLDGLKRSCKVCGRSGKGDGWSGKVLGGC